MKKNNALIWRESVYKNDFVCTCGHKLYNVDEDELDAVIFEDTKGVYCPECNSMVAIITTVEEDTPKGLQGDYNEYCKKKMS